MCQPLVSFGRCGVFRSFGWRVSNQAYGERAAHMLDGCTVKQAPQAHHKGKSQCSDLSALGACIAKCMKMCATVFYSSLCACARTCVWEERDVYHITNLRRRYPEERFQKESPSTLHRRTKERFVVCQLQWFQCIQFAPTIKQRRLCQISASAARWLATVCMRCTIVDLARVGNPPPKSKFPARHAHVLDGVSAFHEVNRISPASSWALNAIAIE